MAKGRSGLKPGRRVSHKAHEPRKAQPLPTPTERVLGPKPEEGPRR